MRLQRLGLRFTLGFGKGGIGFDPLDRAVDLFAFGGDLLAFDRDLFALGNDRQLLLFHDPLGKLDDRFAVLEPQVGAPA